MSDQVDELIKEIAVKHGIAVSRDDPILILQTINNRLMNDSLKAQQEMLDQYKEELEDLTSRWGTETKEKAEKILNASLCASKDAMKQLMQEGTKTMAASVRLEINEAVAEVVNQTINTRKMASLNIIAASIVLLAVAITLWAFM